MTTNTTTTPNADENISLTQINQRKVIKEHISSNLRGEFDITIDDKNAITIKGAKLKKITDKVLDILIMNLSSLDSNKPENIKLDLDYCTEITTSGFIILNHPVALEIKYVSIAFVI